MNKNFTKHFIIYYVVSVFTTLSYAQTTVTFTNAGATGREGPSQSQINTAYDGTTLDDAVTVNTQGIQEWTVPASGTYTIEVWGASTSRHACTPFDLNHPLIGFHLDFAPCVSGAFLQCAAWLRTR